MLRWLIVAAWLAAAPAGASPPAVGQQAPAFELTTFAGERASSQSLKGQVIVINIWATWCAPCRAEMPLIDAYYRMRRDAGLRVYAITTEDSAPPGIIRKLSKRLDMPLVSRMKGGGFGPINGAVPTNFIIDRAGVVRYARAGAFTLATLNAVLVPLLNEPTPADAVVDGAGAR